jgi:hypothetical protein
MGSSVRRSAQCPVDRLLFLLFVRVVLPASAQEASFGRSPRGWRSVVTKHSCRPHFHCAEWSCVVLSGSPRHRIGSGTNWPVKSPIRKLPTRTTFSVQLPVCLNRDSYRIGLLSNATGWPPPSRIMSQIDSGSPTWPDSWDSGTPSLAARSQTLLIRPSILVESSLIIAL